MKTIFITGVSKGLGLQLFTQAYSKGYKVYGLVRNKQDYERMLKDCPDNGQLVLADVQTDGCINEIRKVVGDVPVDLVINNAGIGGTGMVLNDTTTTEILELFNTHCLGALRVVKALKENMLCAAKATVINMNSRFGSITYQYEHVFRGFDISYSYRIAKASQNMLTNCLRIEFSDRVEFVSVTPGRLITNMAQKDANLSVEEGARRIINHWERGLFKCENGILQVQGDVTPW